MVHREESLVIVLGLFLVELLNKAFGAKVLGDLPEQHFQEHPTGCSGGLRLEHDDLEHRPVNSEPVNEVAKQLG